MLNFVKTIQLDVLFQTKNIPIETILNSEAEKDELRNEISSLQHRITASETETKTAAAESSKLQQVVLYIAIGSIMYSSR